jgi:crotonobetainyl-CoA:carnitine CoA-transferase CaiB-like acyl-CoA transferase
MIAAGDNRAMLDGLKVVDLTTVVFGPYCTQILSDLGADVTKVETPGSGDVIRWSGRAAVTPGMSPVFMALNRGKRSVALDLKRAADLERMKRLLADADVFVVNVRGQALKRLGLDYEAVKALNPRIIYAHCVGFGQTGPYADLQAYDDVIQAASGVASLLPRVDGNPRPRYIPSLIADKVAGLHAAYAVLAAITHRLRTGAGQHIEIPMFEAFTHFMMLEHLGGLTFDPPNAPPGYSRQLDPDRQPFPTCDGHVSIVAYSDDAWFRLFEVLGAPTFLDQPQFATRKLRVDNLAQLYRGAAELTVQFRSGELIDKCHAADLPAMAVRDLSQIMDDPHLQATGFFEPDEHPTEGRHFALARPVKFASAPARKQAHAPLLGADNDR